MASLPLIIKYLIVFGVSMVPIVELRGAIPIAEGLGLNISNINNRKYASCSYNLFICKKST